MSRRETRPRQSAICRRRWPEKNSAFIGLLRFQFQITQSHFAAAAPRRWIRSPPPPRFAVGQILLFRPAAPFPARQLGIVTSVVNGNGNRVAVSHIFIRGDVVRSRAPSQNDGGRPPAYTAETATICGSAAWMTGRVYLRRNSRAITQPSRPAQRGRVT